MLRHGVIEILCKYLQSILGLACNLLGATIGFLFVLFCLNLDPYGPVGPLQDRTTGWQTDQL